MVYLHGKMQVAEQHMLFDPTYVVENKWKLIVLGKKEHKNINFLVWKPRCGSTHL